MHLQTDSGMTGAEKRVRIGITGIGITVIGAVIAHGGTIRIHIRIHILILVLVHIVIIAITMRTGMMIGGHLADHRTNGVIVLRIIGHERSFNI